jgi:hypothetical protein
VSFAIGSRVRTRTQRTGGHTRLPGYLQAKPGTIVHRLGAFPFPDERAVDPQHFHESELYTVEFATRDVWPEIDYGTVRADLFEEYLELLK